MAYGCAGSSPAFRTILKGSNNAKLLFPFEFPDLGNSFFGLLCISLVYLVLQGLQHEGDPISVAKPIVLFLPFLFS